MASRTNLTDEMVETALQYYVEMSLDVKTFAEMLSITQAAARTILQGVSWKHIPRPEGFSYTWREKRTRPPVQATTLEGVLAENEAWAEDQKQKRKERQDRRRQKYSEEQAAKGIEVTQQMTDQELEAAFVRFVEEKMTVEQFATMCDVAVRYAGELLTGKRRPKVKRPAALVTPDKKQKVKTAYMRQKETWVQLALELYTQEKWSTEQFAEFLGVTRQQGCEILLGQCYPDVPRPPGFEYRRFKRNAKKEVTLKKFAEGE